MSRLWHGALVRAVPLACVLAVATMGGGCSYQLGSMLGQSEERPKHAEAVTGSVSAVELPNEADLSYTRAAVSEALSKGGTTRSTPWENPRTGARGMITPIATAYTQDGLQCRDFLASYVHGGSESWLEGEACRAHQGRWEVKSLKPWKKT